MEKILFLVFLVVMSLTSCNNRNASAETQRRADSVAVAIQKANQFREAYQMIKVKSDTKEVKIHFMEGESPFYDVFVVSDKCRSVDVGFFRADDVDSEGRIKTGKSLIRVFCIYIPQDEEIESWGHGGMILLRPDGTKHEIKFILVDQP